MGIAAKAGIGLTDGFRAFVKVGYHSWKVEQTTDEDGTDFLYGIGLEYKLSATTAVVAGYDRFTYDTDNITGRALASNIVSSYSAKIPDKNALDARCAQWTHFVEKLVWANILPKKPQFLTWRYFLIRDFTMSIKHG